MVTWNFCGGSRTTISFTVRFCALVSDSSANDGVKIVIISAKLTKVRGYGSPNL
jgi:hypothetical protein